MSVKLCSLNDIKDALRISHSETSIDAVLQDFVHAASGECERFTDRSFTYASHANEPYRGGGDTVVLKQYPVDTAASFQVKTYNQWGDFSTFDSTDYVLDDAAGIVRLIGLTFASTPNGAAVSYAAGYADSGTGDDLRVGVPDDLAGSVADYAADLYRAQQGALTPAQLKESLENAKGKWSTYKRIR